LLNTAASPPVALGGAAAGHDPVAADGLLAADLDDDAADGRAHPAALVDQPLAGDRERLRRQLGGVPARPLHRDARARLGPGAAVAGAGGQAQQGHDGAHHDHLTPKVAKRSAIFLAERS
jgi:hypothetical protein